MCRTHTRSAGYQQVAGQAPRADSPPLVPRVDTCVGLFQLNDLQETAGQWFIIDARDINNRGQIAAYARAQDGSGREGAVRLTPIARAGGRAEVS